MSGNTFGKLFKVTSFGESHGIALGCIIDGCPPGIELNEKDIQIELDKRKPGKGLAGTKRSETDSVKILSGVFEGKTTGTAIGLIVYNKDQKSRDYSLIKDIFRPGHADYTYQKKYGFRDYRGGGRSSGRETWARVAAGAIAKKILKEKGVEIRGFVKEIAGITAENFDENDLEKIYDNSLRMPDSDARKKAEEKIKNVIEENDSVGGIVELLVKGIPKGLGEPVFEKIDAKIGGALFSLGAVKGVEFGAGFKVSNMKGSENNDAIIIENGKEKFATNKSGGILGGITNGEEVVVKIAVKPTASIGKKQKTVNIFGNEEEIEIKGRHDACICPRMVPVAESMIALVMLDLLMEHKSINL